MLESITGPVMQAIITTSSTSSSSTTAAATSAAKAAVNWLEILPVIIVVLTLIALAVNGLACSLMIKGAKDKGYYTEADSDSWMLWVIALLSPLGIVAVGLITCTLPDKRLQKTASPAAARQAVEDELPSI